MKNIITLLAIAIFASSFGQNPAKFKDGINLPNGTELTTTNRIPIIGANGDIKHWISITNLFNPITTLLDDKVDKESGKSLILDSEITRLSTVTNQDVSGIVVNADAIDALEAEQITQNEAIGTNTAKTGITNAQATAIVANTDKVGITSGQASAIVANTDKVGITLGQASAIVTNTNKTGITTSQASAIVTNTDKVGITTSQASAITANTNKVGITTAEQNKLSGIQAGAQVNGTIDAIPTNGSNNAVSSNGTFDALATKINTSEKGANNGVASLGSDGKVPNNQIPALAISETFEVSSQAQMLALSQAEQGDVAVRSDVSQAFILRQTPVSTLANWVQLLTPASTVTSVAGRVGVVVLNKDDVGLSNVPNLSFSGINSGDQDLSSFATTSALNLKANIASPTFTGTVGGITKAMVGLSNVPNLSFSGSNTGDNATNTQYSGLAASKANIASPTFTGTVNGITKAMVGLSNVPNLSFSGINTGDQDLSSFATTSALNGKANNTITIATGTGLTGGGNLTANRTFNVTYGTTAGTAAQGSDARLSDVRNPIITYNNNFNSNFQMLFGSGNAAFGTAAVTVNPATNTITASNLNANGIVGVVADGAANNPYGKISVTRGTASNFAYYGLTRAGQVGWSMGVATNNDFLIGQGAAGANIITAPRFRLSNNGDATFNGNVTANNFIGNGSQLTNVNAAQLGGLNSGQFLRSDADDIFSGGLISNSRNSGVFGTYNASLTDQIWSMGTAYRNNATGANFGNLYGLAYKHTNNPTGGNMAGGHQMVWVENGIPRVALGTNIWASGGVTATNFIGNGSQLTAVNSTSLGGVVAANYMRKDINQQSFGTITANNFILSSDRRLKTKIKDLQPNHIPVNWKSFRLKTDKKEYRVGVIAQELEKTNPEFVNTDDKGMKSVKYLDLMMAKIAELESTLINLQKEIKKLKSNK